MRSFLLALSLMACSADPAPPEPAAPVAPTPRPAPPAASLLGVVAARTTEVVAARIDGRILRVAATTGQRVHAGDPIVELDPTLLGERLRAAAASVEAARAGVAEAGAEVAEAQRQLALERRMFAANATAEESVRTARARVARAVAGAARATAALREADANHAASASQLSDTRLVAPIDGVLSLVKARTGEVVAPGVAVARVFDPGALMIRFQVPSERRGEVTTGAVFELAVAGGAVLHARVASVSSDLEPPLDFAVAEADLVEADAAHGLQIGTTVDVRVAAR